MHKVDSLSLVNRAFSESEFSSLIEYIKKQTSFSRPVKEIIFTKELITEDQIQRVQALASSLKNFKVLDSDGGQMGSAICNWSHYNQDKKDAYAFGIRKTTKKAIKWFKEAHCGKLPNEILDFGAGTGQDAIPLLEMGCPHLTVLDADEEALDILVKNVPQEFKQRITCINTPLKDYLPVKLFDFINSSFSWPYRPPEEFPFFWDKTVNLLSSKGLIAGHFFSQPDKPESGMTYHSKEKVKTLLEKDFEILWFSEQEGTPIYGGEIPPWKVLYEVVARKKD